MFQTGGGQKSMQMGGSMGGGTMGASVRRGCGIWSCARAPGASSEASKTNNIKASKLFFMAFLLRNGLKERRGWQREGSPALLVPSLPPLYNPLYTIQIQPQ